jgi:hypothetical protein
LYRDGSARFAAVKILVGESHAKKPKKDRLTKVGSCLAFEPPSQ